MPRAALVVLALLASLLAGCGEGTTDAGVPPSSTAPTETPTETPEGDPEADDVVGLDLAPPVTLVLDDEEVDLQPWTSCYRSACSDGFPPPDPYDVGDRDEVRFTYPLEDWRFSATFREVTDSRCGRSFSAPVAKNSAGSWVIRPVGYAGTYDVDVNGQGDGDANTTFRWTTDQDGPLPTPTSTLSPVHNGKGEIDHFGVTLHVGDLADVAQPPSATLEVTAANGRTRTLTPRMAHVGQGEFCTTSGTVGFDYDGKDGRALAKIGRAPFTYVLRLTLDGTVHTSTVVWPGPDADPRGGSLRLTFDPPLPALQ